MSEHYELYKAELRNFKGDYINSRQQINGDSDLSPEGKQKRLAELKEAFDVKRNDLLKRSSAEYDKSVQGLEKAFKGKTQESFRSKVKRKAVEDSSYSLLSTSEETAALIESFSEVTEAMNRNTFIGSIGHLDEQKIKEVLQHHHKTGNISRVKWIKGFFDDRGNLQNSDVATVFIKELENKNITPEQHKLKIRMAALEKEKLLFEQAVHHGEEEHFDGIRFDKKEKD